MAVEGAVDAAPARDRTALRALIAFVVIVVMTAAATAAAGLLQVAGVGSLIVSIPGPAPQVDAPDPGKPETILLLGTDGRLGADAGGGQRSDTMLLVHLDAGNPAITMMSIPRDLRVQIPGYGMDKINASFTLGGAALTLKTIKSLLSTPGRPFKINHVVQVNFTGFRDLVNYFGCVYVDVDRRYFNNVGGPFGYAVIDIPQGYQKVCGDDALAYVRYRHTDSDLVRGARQQDFLRQMLHQPSVRDKIKLGNVKKLARLGGRFTRTDRGLTKTKQLLSLLELGLAVKGKPVAQIPFAKSGISYAMLSGVSYVEATPDAIQASVRQFLHPAEPRKTKRRVRRAPLTGVADYTSSGQAQAVAAGGDAGIPVYYPKLLRTGSFYADNAPRVYKLAGKPAYRMSIQLNGVDGAFYGVQGMKWRNPPILAGPRKDVVVAGRRLSIYGEGSKVTLVAWRTKQAVYYVHNTLTQDLTRSQMVAIARSLTRA